MIFLQEQSITPSDIHLEPDGVPSFASRNTIYSLLLFLKAIYTKSLLRYVTGFVPSGSGTLISSFHRLSSKFRSYLEAQGDQSNPFRTAEA